MDDDFHDPRLSPPINLPIKGRVYTLRDPFSADGWTWWRLVEITNTPSRINAKYGIQEPGFAPRHFRPIVSRKTDISALKALLVPGAKIREDA